MRVRAGARGERARGGERRQKASVLISWRHWQAIRVPVGAKAGMMLSVKVPIKAALEEEGSGAEHEGGAKPDDDIVEEVEEEAEVVEEDVVFTWTHFFLLIAFVGAGTVVMFYFFRGMTSGFGPLQVDPRKIVDHPCRFCDSKTAELAEQQMRRRRELGSEDTPENTPRASSEPVTPRGAAEGKKKEEKKEHHAKPAAANAGTSAVREMGRAQGFTKQDVAPKGVTALQDEGAAIKQTVKDQPQGAVETTHDKELFGGSEASVDADFELTSQEVFAEVWERGKWLVLLMIFQSLASMVLAQFEDLIKQHVVIALFLTMLIGSGGNAGGQSVAKAIHEIAVRGRTSGDMTLALRAAKRSIAVALWLAVILAWTAWVRVWIFHGGMENSLAISSSCGVIVFSSIIIGSMLPYAMLALGMDEIHAGAVIQVAMDIYGVTVTCIVCWFIWG